jgi:hypothetical protein
MFSEQGAEECIGPKREEVTGWWRENNVTRNFIICTVNQKLLG